MDRKRRILPYLLPPLLALAVLWVLLAATHNLKGANREQGRLLMENSIRRSAAAYYAREGSFPPSLAVLEQHYGLQIDHERYAVFYEIFAPNLMPSITVLDQAGD